VACQAFQISTLLSQPACTIIKQIEINYDHIEVLPKGTFFWISKKSFTKEPNFTGSPRAFVFYTYRPGYLPKPKPFMEGMFS